MRSSKLKSVLLFATLVSTAVTSAVVWMSWGMLSTPLPTIEGIVGMPTPGQPAQVAEHGEKAEPGEPGERAPASVQIPAAPVVALDEVYVSLGTPAKRTRSLVVNLELELFEEKGRDTIDRFRPAVRDLVLQTAMEQPYEELKTLPGKLSFKEILVARINKLVNQPAIRNVHFATFYLQ